MKTERIDKSTWGEGRWQTEPDRVEWEHKGLPCLMLRHARGHWCGYVAVGRHHPFFEKGYEDLPVEVHGGLTYASHCNGHVCHVPKSGESDEVWWLGFDMAHSGDFSPGIPFPFGLGGCYRDAAYVKEEVESLADQLAAIPSLPDTSHESY